MVVGSRFFELPRLIWWWSKPDSFLILQTTVVLGTHGRQASHASSAMCQKASQSLGENLQVLKERADRLSFKSACHSQTEANPVWLNSSCEAVTPSLLRSLYLVESATVEEE